MSSLRSRALAAALCLSSLGAPTLAGPLQEDAALEPLFSIEGITEYRLENGLRVLLFPDNSKQTVTVNVTYMVGSRHEGRGETGMAHLLEHMVFKGTDTYPNIWGALEDHGARFNGTTWVDRTNYFETLPATEDNLRFALHMEADRMVNSHIAGEDLAKEMTVVRNEFERGENDPGSILFERVVSAAYLWHNYGKSTIGNRSDIERVPVANLKRFYQRYYQPDNAMLVVAGAFDPELALDLVSEGFGEIPRPERVLENTYTEEPVQDGPRFVTLERVASTKAAAAAYHVPAGSHPDMVAVQVLAQVLADQPSGRVYQALVPTDMATDVGSFSFPTAEPGLLMVMVEAGLEHDIHAAHDRMLEVTEGLGSDPITEEEVERAKTKLLKNIKLALTNSGRIGVELSEWQALGDWRMFFVHRDRLKEVGLADVRRVAASYLVESNRTSGVFEPVEDPVRAEIPPTPDVQAIVDGYEGSESIAQGEEFEPTPENIERRTRRLVLPSGIKVASLSKETRGDAAVARFTFHYGTETDLTGHTEAADLIPALLMRGTGRLSYQELRDAIDKLGVRLNVGGELGAINASIAGERGNLGPAIELLGEVLKTPAMPEDEFGIIKKEKLAGLEEGLTDPQTLLVTAMRRALRPFPATSIHYVPTIEEELARTEAVTLNEVRQLYDSLMGASHADVSLVGDFDHDAITQTVERVFGPWKSKKAYARVPRPFAEVQAAEATIRTPDKKMAMVAMGTSIPMKDDDQDYAALSFANYVLGQSAKSRLLNRLRHEGGLSYGAGSQLEANSFDPVAVLLGFAICAPENADEAQSAMHEEIERWIADGVTPEELVEGKQGFLQQMDSQMANDSFVAGELLDGLELDRTFAYQRWLMDEVSGLTLERVEGVLSEHLADEPLVQLKAGDLETAQD